MNEKSTNEITQKEKNLGDGYSLKQFMFDKEIEKYNNKEIKIKPSSSFYCLRDFVYYSSTANFFASYRPHMNNIINDATFRNKLFTHCTTKFQQDGLDYLLFFYIKEILPQEYNNKENSGFFEELVEFAKYDKNLNEETANRFYFSSYLLYHEFNLPERFNLKPLMQENEFYVNMYREIYTSGIKNKKLIGKVFPAEELKKARYSRQSHSSTATSNGEELIDIKTKFQLTILYNNTNSIKKFKRTIDYFESMGLKTDYELLHRVIKPTHIKNTYLNVLQDSKINELSYDFKEQKTSLENISKYNSMVRNLELLLNKNHYGYLVGFNQEKLNNFQEAGLYYSTDPFLKPFLLDLIEFKLKKAQITNKAKWNNLKLEITINKYEIPEDKPKRVNKI